MKKINYVRLAGLLVAAIVITSCGGPKKMLKNEALITYTVSPTPLEMHGDSVLVKITGKIPEKYFHAKTVVEGTPVLVFKSGGEKALTTKKYQGEKVEGNNPVIKYESGGTFEFSEKIPYQEEMRLSTLEVRLKGYKYKKPEKFVDFTKKEVAKGVVSTPTLLQMDSKVIMATDNFVRTTPDSKEASILYDMSKSNLKDKELKKDEVKALKEFIDLVSKGERKEYKGIDVAGQASPDGPVDFNSKLSDDRAKSARKFFEDEYAKIDKGIDDFNKQGQQKLKTKKITEFKEIKKKNVDIKAMVKPMAKGQDWDGFKNMLQSSNIQDKDLILRVLNMYQDADTRNKEIKNLKQVFGALKNDVLPQLRKSTIKVNIDVVGYSDEELLQLAESTPDSLKIEEIMKAATVTQDQNRQLGIYKSAAKKFPNDWRTNNNVGFVSFNQGKVADAKTAFEDAKKASATSQVFNNLGACALKDKDFDKAKENLTSAGSSNETSYNLGIISFKKAQGPDQYSDAISKFGSYNTVNAALAKLLSGKVDEAIAILDKAENKDDAMVFYVKAICGARKGNTETLFNNLRSAVGKDANLANTAKTDMEFFKYFEDDTFKSIVK